MSLLPEFNQHFIDLWHIEVGRELARGKEPNAMQIPRDLLNPDLNPLTFDEVKAWFDRQADENPHIWLKIPISHYKPINSPFSFFLHKNEWTTYLYKYQPYEPESICVRLNEIPEYQSLTPLELFCQMKGYVNI